MSHEHGHEDGCCGDASRRVDAAVTRMKEKSLRVTAPRMSILRVLAESADPLSAEDVHRLAGHGALDLVTAYRSLGALEEKRAALEAFVDFYVNEAITTLGGTGDGQVPYVPLSAETVAAVQQVWADREVGTRDGG